MDQRVTLRDVTADDLPILFEYQRDPEANAMAAFPARERPEFDAHWERTRRDESAVVQAIVAHDDVVGSVLSFVGEDGRYVGYWIGRAHWGNGYASDALAQFLEVVTERPLHAIVVRHNGASQRVLEKCGFAVVDSRTGDDGVEELVYRLEAS